jgi:hypothetical protein
MVCLLTLLTQPFWHQLTSRNEEYLRDDLLYSYVLPTVAGQNGAVAGTCFAIQGDLQIIDEPKAGPKAPPSSPFLWYLYRIIAGIVH